MEMLEASKSDYELERGKPLPTWNHALLQQRILVRIASQYEGKFSVLPELNLSILGAKLVPDLAVFPGEAHFLAHDNPLVSEAPLITVEILSPPQSIAELTSRTELYLQAGVKSCWVVVPELNSIVVSTSIGNYQTFDRHEKLVDPITGIELELSLLFK